MPKRNIIIFIIILILIGGAVYGLRQIKKKTPLEELFPEVKENIISLPQDTVDYITQNIDKLSPAKPVLGGNWYVTRFSLIDKNHLYVDYEDGHISARLLLEKTEDNWHVLGYFKPGKDMWELTEGKDPYLGHPLTIYEKGEDGKWSLAY